MKAIKEFSEQHSREMIHVRVSAELSKLKKGDKVVMHTCMEHDNPKYYGKVWTCKSDAFRHKGHDYCSIFLEGFSGSFSTEFLQLVNLDELENESTRLKNLIGGIVGSLTAWSMHLDDTALTPTEFRELQRITKPLFEEANLSK